MKRQLSVCLNSFAHWWNKRAAQTRSSLQSLKRCNEGTFCLVRREGEGRGGEERGEGEGKRRGEGEGEGEGKGEREKGRERERRGGRGGKRALGERCKRKVKAHTSVHCLCCLYIRSLFL